MALANCLPCLFRPGRPQMEAATSSSPRSNDDSPETLVTLVGYGAPDQRLHAAHRIAIKARQGPEASENRMAFMKLGVLASLLGCLLPGHSDRLRVAAAQALCNLALECHAAERRESMPGARYEQHSCMLYKALDTVVPALCMLLERGPAEASVFACQALSNLMLGGAFVPRVLHFMGPLPGGEW